MRRLPLVIGTVVLSAGACVVGLTVASAGGAARLHLGGTRLARAESAAAINCQGLEAQFQNPRVPSAAYSIAASYPSTAGQIATWDSAIEGTGPTTVGGGPGGSLLSSYPSADVVSVCFVSGPIESAGIGASGPTNGKGFNSGIYVILPNGLALPLYLSAGSEITWPAPPTTSTSPTIARSIS